MSLSHIESERGNVFVWAPRGARESHHPYCLDACSVHGRHQPSPQVVQFAAMSDGVDLRPGKPWCTRALFGSDTRNFVGTTFHFTVQVSLQTRHRSALRIVVFAPGVIFSHRPPLHCTHPMTALTALRYAAARATVDSLAQATPKRSFFGLLRFYKHYIIWPSLTAWAILADLRQTARWKAHKRRYRLE